MNSITLKMFSTSGFGDDISHLVLSLMKDHFNKPLFYIVLQEVMSNINMIRMLMINQVLGYIYSTGVIAPDRNTVNFHSEIQKLFFYPEKLRHNKKQQ